MQKLREFRRVHELSWGDEILLDPETGRTRSKPERGRALNDQRANAVADLAAVLSGEAGEGSKMWIETDEERKARLSLRPIPVDQEAVKAKRRLYDVTVFWDNERDKGHAPTWPANVTHRLLADWAPPERPVEVDDGEAGPEVVAEALAVEEQPRQPVVA